MIEKKRNKNALIPKRQTFRNPIFWKKSRLKILQWMVFAVSTEPVLHTRIVRKDNRCYTISPHVRVRKETFGLLFYSLENSTLTFVKSGDILQIQALPHGAKTLSVSMEPGTQAKVSKLLDHLIKKRLIRES